MICVLCISIMRKVEACYTLKEEKKMSVKGPENITELFSFSSQHKKYLTSPRMAACERIGMEV